MKLEKLRDLTLPTAVLGLSASSDSERLYAACIDGAIYEVEVASGAATPFLEKHTSYASGALVVPNSATVISAGYDGFLLWHDLESKRAFRRVKAHDFWSWQMALSPDGARVATVTGQYLVGGEKYEPAVAEERTVKVYATCTGDLLHAFDHLPPVLSTAFSPDGQHLAAANMMGEVRVWDLSSGELAATFATSDFTSWGIIKSPHYIGGIYALAFAPQGETILCCGMGQMTDPMAGNGKMIWQRWAWREKPAKKIGQIRDGENGAGLMESLAHSPDGTLFFMGGRQAQGTWNGALFSTANGKLLASIDTKSRVTRAAFKRDGTQLFLAAAIGQPHRTKEAKWPDYGRIHMVAVG